MKIEIEESDLELSDSFKKKDATFIHYEEKIKSKIKKQISNTQEAILFFDKYKYVYKEKAKADSKSPNKQFKYILKDLLDSFTSADKFKVTKHLIRNGIIPFNLKQALIYLLIINGYLILAILAEVSGLLISIALLSMSLIYFMWED